MATARSLRRAFLRWDRVFRLGIIALSVLLCSLLGFLWLSERGYLLIFFSINAGLVGLSLVGRALVRRKQPPRPSVAPEHMHTVQENPDWTDRERHAYAAACQRIDAQLAQPMDWAELPQVAIDLVGTVAKDMSRGQKTALSFTLPEALLLIDRVALRYRGFLRTRVPFSDQVSVNTAAWVWRHRETMQRGWQHADGIRRVLRLAVNPPVGIVREMERWMTVGLQDRLTTEFMTWIQTVLLQEVAHAAIELHSGRLRFSDAELLEIQLGTELADRQRLAQPDDPVRILAVGQVSAGKSTLINALLASDRAETDMAPTTASLTAHEITIDGIPCRLIDGPGLDGSSATLKRTRAEMANCDLVLWVVRANRPGRGPDHALQEEFQIWFNEHPERRRPPVITVATCVDLLLPGWPFPENRLPPDEQQRMGHVMKVIGEDLGRQPLPVRAEDPAWNIETVERAIGTVLTEALMTQRNRRRAEGAAVELGVGKNASRAAKGLGRGVRGIGRHILRRHGDGPKEK